MPISALVPIDHIKHTLATATSSFTMHIAFDCTDHFKPCFRATNISCHNEPVTTNTMFSDDPAIGSNTTAAQIFIRHNLNYIDIYGVATDWDLSHMLEENIMN